MIQALTRGIRILDFLVENRTAGCSEIAGVLSINKSSAYRLLATLERHDLVQQDPATSKYMLGVGILRLGEGLLNHISIVDVAKPIMKSMVKRIGEGAHLCTLSHNKAAVIADVKSDSKIIVSAKLGAYEPLHCSAVGKCLLAFSSAEARKDLLKSVDYKQYTGHTITTREGLLAEIEKTLKNGYAVDNEEINDGIRCIAAPIRDHLGEVNYCVGISGTAGRITQAKVGRFAGAAKECARAISEKMGYFD